MQKLLIASYKLEIWAFKKTYFEKYQKKLWKGWKGHNLIS
jgi:hypothetical protein